VVLAVTVGGSCAPVVTAIRDYQPDHVLFFASSGPKGSRSAIDGAGKVCQDNANILSQTNLPEGRYTIVEIDEPDDLPRCYAAMRKGLAELAAKHPDWRRVGDYTGGTKTMSAALVLAALELGWELSLVKGTRTDLVRVIDGTEMAGLVNAWEVRVHQLMAQGKQLFNSYSFAAAGELLEGVLRVAPVSAEVERTIKKWVALSRGFDAWDRFDHDRAYHLLEPFQSSLAPDWWVFLKVLAGKARGSGYEPVFDLLLNAERRAARGRYDDAVARLYRALEWMAQIRLAQREPPLDAGNIQVDLLPEPLRAEYAAMRKPSHEPGKMGKVQLGLVEGFVLLARLGDPLGRVYGESWSQVRATLQAALEKRNYSILAHGTRPLGQADYQAMREQVERLVQDGLGALGIKRVGRQFPQLTESGVVPR
jgi:hypothetical protein